MPRCIIKARRPVRAACDGTRGLPDRRACKEVRYVCPANSVSRFMMFQMHVLPYYSSEFDDNLPTVWIFTTYILRVVQALANTFRLKNYPLGWNPSTPGATESLLWGGYFFRRAGELVVFRFHPRVVGRKLAYRAWHSYFYFTSRKRLLRLRLFIYHDWGTSAHSAQPQGI